ncbi:hypothetical protein Tco_0676707 [Tanacetum coccineum]
MNENENLFVPASMGYDYEMVPKTKDSVERLIPDSKLPNFKTRRILVLESQAVNESLKPSETSITPESSKDSEIESITPLPPLKNIQGASPSSEVMPLTFQPHSPKERPGLGIMKHTKPETQDSSNKSVSRTVTISETEPTTPLVPTEVKDTEQESKINELTKLVQMILYCMICKREDHMISDHEMYTASLKKSKNYKDQAYQHDDCRNYHECEICGSYDHFTLGHNRIIHIRERVLPESSQSSESVIGVKCNTCRRTVHSTTDHSDFDHFKRETHQGAYLVPGQFTNTLVDEIGIDDSSRYPPDEFLHEDDPSRQYQVDSDVSYYGNRLGRLDQDLTEVYGVERRFFLYFYFIESSVMSYSDELIHSNGTTPIFPRYPYTLPYVYTRGHSTLRFSTFPPPLSSYPTSRRTARMSVIPVIEMDLAERARIAAFNLDDYQDDPESPPPSPLSPYLFATYQKMIAEADLTKREKGSNYRPTLRDRGWKEFCVCCYNISRRDSLDCVHDTP